MELSEPSLRHIISEHVILPLSDLLTGQCVYKCLQFLKKSSLWSESRLEEFQNERLRIMIRHVSRNVPYYRDFFAENHLRAEDICTRNDLEKLPIVSKELIRKEGVERFVSENIGGIKKIKAKSSGSTGMPFSFFVSKKAYSMNTASKLYTWYQAGYRLGDKYMKIANGPRHGVLKKLQDMLNNCVYVPFSEISDRLLDSILTTIDKEKPLYIRSYPIPLYLLAKYRNEHLRFHHNPRYVMTTGSTLPQEYRDEIEKAFNCFVIDSYSCEGTPNTAQTPAQNGYRVTDEYAIMEVLSEKNERVDDGIGRVVSTDLWNEAFPFIRYDTKDLVEVLDGNIMRIIGRDCEAFVSTDEKIFTVHNFSRFFLHDIASVLTYQVVKMKDDSIKFKIVVSPDYKMEDDLYIKDYWSKKIGKTIAVEHVAEIPLMKNNKRLTIVEE